MRKAYLIAIALVASSYAFATEYNNLNLSEHGEINFIRINEGDEEFYYLELLMEIQVVEGDTISFEMEHDLNMIYWVEPYTYLYKKHDPIRLHVSKEERDHMIKFGISNVATGTNIYWLDSLENISFMKQAKLPLDMNLKKPIVEFEKDKRNSFYIHFDMEEGIAHEENPLSFLIGGQNRSFIAGYNEGQLIDYTEFLDNVFMDDKQSIKDLKKYGLISVSFNRKTYYFTESEQKRLAELARKYL